MRQFQKQREDCLKAGFVGQEAIPVAPPVKIHGYYTVGPMGRRGNYVVTAHQEVHAVMQQAYQEVCLAVAGKMPCSPDNVHCIRCKFPSSPMQNVPPPAVVTTP